MSMEVSLPDPFRYEGKRVVVTGGATGVGAALLEVLGEQGAGHVTVLDLKQPTGPHDQFIQADLSKRDAVDSALGAIEGPVHALFNNAGVADTLPPRTVFSVNYLAVRRLSEGLLDRMPEGSGIANTASIAGGQWPARLAEITELLGISDWDEALAWMEGRELGAEPYAFTKECVQVYTMRSSHQTLAKGVRTNSVCPAPIDTPLLDDFRKTMTDALIDWTVGESGGRLVTGREVALALAFLNSDAASYISGVNLNIDNGFTAAMTTGQVDFSALNLG
jgi:NAD(P)-dependent dehydrogenase (short-subunit alcohol dehydrogenase family)